jgi:hypothetical protein
MLKKLYLSIYRAVGLGLISATLGLLAFYAGLMIFFFINTTWVAPTILSSTSDKMLQFSGAYQRGAQGVVTATLAKEQAQLSLEFVYDSLVAAKRLLAFTETRSAGARRHLGDKASNNVESQEIVSKFEQLRKSIDQSLSAKLITQDEATRMITGLQQFQNTSGDALVTTITTDVAIAVQIAQIRQQVAALESELKVRQASLESAEQSLKLAQAEVQKLEKTVYFQASALGSNLAFVPYENRDVAQIGAGVYDCRLMVIVCRQVGTITDIYSDEQVIDFPMFNVRFSRTVRGFFVKLDMTEPSSMSSPIVFVGGKPLFL